MEKKETFLQEILYAFGKEKTSPDQYSPLALAYIGDGVYDLIIRSIIVEKGNRKVNMMHRQTASIVRAVSQAKLMRLLEGELTEDERNIYRRGRNAKSATAAKNASIVDYRVATGFEALIGYLYLDDQTERMLQLVKKGLDMLKQSEEQEFMGHTASDDNRGGEGNGRRTES